MRRRVHASAVLREEIFAVEFAAALAMAASSFRAGAEGADPGGEIEMLRADVALPFVFGGEGRGAAGEVEDAGVGSGVLRGDVAGEGGGVLEGVGAGWACVCCIAGRCGGGGGGESGFRLFGRVGAAAFGGLLLGVVRRVGGGCGAFAGVDVARGVACSAGFGLIILVFGVRFHDWWRRGRCGFFDG